MSVYPGAKVIFHHDVGDHDSTGNLQGCKEGAPSEHIIFLKNICKATHEERLCIIRISFPMTKETFFELWPISSKKV